MHTGKLIGISKKQLCSIMDLLSVSYIPPLFYRRQTGRKKLAGLPVITTGLLCNFDSAT